MGVGRLSLVLLLLLAGRGSWAVTIWRPPANTTALEALAVTFTAPTVPIDFRGVGTGSNWADPHMTYFRGWYYLVYTTGWTVVKMARSRTITFKTKDEKVIWSAIWYPRCCPAHCGGKCDARNLPEASCVLGCEDDEEKGHEWAISREWQFCQTCPEGKSPMPWDSPHWKIWAPAMHRFRGDWYIYFSSSTAEGAISKRDIHVLRKKRVMRTGGANFLTPWPSDEAGDSKWGYANNREKLEFKGVPYTGYVRDFELLEARGKLYGMFSSHEKAGSAIQAVYITEMADPLTPTGSSMVLTKPDKIWEKPDKILEEQGLRAVNEGPTALYAPDGGIFVAYSASHASSNDYCLGLLTLKKDSEGKDRDPMRPGSWKKAEDPVFSTVLYSKHDKKRDSAIGPGHNSFVKGRRGTYWIVYHVHTGYGGYSTGAKCPEEKPDVEERESRAQKFTWTRNKRKRPNFPAPGST